ncbi:MULTISPECIES: Crp/Fnr family transcriptional regulator [unclassified Tenacibaculum]|uniref:Crp/Fnr family transcriptional regulator n=1 Tax=unclassified Tenacibaculum TaxID=2635139 RepID=UPI001F3D7D46|nr:MULTISPECIES: Crp/Fnr family transcriptional regulator [unclassified Tenacibaculum]MCF2876489.1 Crp/Fnr family transcriptional regulator [Tenacibaculum sp. Cn5-1]MCF2936604.1 Crp/Fnr family transcriptional regulator [Tenacibaculum sp. Cn5-34]MCG7511803.1 Crp/Fnr family transcriptional regulator [Tenacibaculum sp. Cn5-46]
MIENFINQLGITEEALQNELREIASISTHQKGEFIIKNNQYIKVLKIVLKGKVRVYQENEDREILIYYLNAMEACTLSLSACFEDCKSTVNAIVEEECTLINIPVRFVRDWNFKYKSWNTFTTKTFRESYNHLINQYANLAFQPLKDRLFDYLLAKADNNIVKKSHQELARELGTTREVISRLLKKLEKNNQLHLGQKEIVLLNNS